MLCAIGIDLPPGQACRPYLDDEYLDYDASAARKALSNEAKRQQRERDKATFLNEFEADYDWGPYPWSCPNMM